MSLWFETACQFILIDHKIENMPKHTFHKHFHTNSLSTLQSKCYLDKGSESTSLWGLAVCLHRLQTTEHLFMLGRAPAWRAICSWLSPDCVGPWKKHSKLPSLPQTHSPMSMEAQKANGGTGKAVHRRQEWHLLTLLHSFVRAAGAAQPQRWTVLPAFSPCQSWPTEIPHNKSELVRPRTTNKRRVFWEFSVQLQVRNRLLLAGVSSCQELEFGAHLWEETACVTTCGHLLQRLNPTSFLEVV